jgi:hypothetical protein
LKSTVVAVQPVVLAVTSGTLPIVAGMTVPRSRSSAWSDALLVPFPAQRHHHTGGVARVADVHRDRLVHHTGGERRTLERRDPGGDLRSGNVGRGDHDHRGAGASRELRLNMVVDLLDGQAVRDSLGAGVDRVQAERRDRERDQQRYRRSAPEDGPAQDDADDRRPHARLSIAGAASLQERDPASVDAVTELRQHRGKDRQRAEHRDRDDQHRADSERGEDLRAHQEHA